MGDFSDGGGEVSIISEVCGEGGLVLVIVLGDAGI